MIELGIPPFNDGLCGQADPEDFHPEGTGLAKTCAENRAKAICNGAPDSGIDPCPARESCLMWQLQYEGDLSARGRYGVYGGLNPDERARLAKKNRKAAA